MPCDTALKYRQTISQRVDEVKKVVAKTAAALAAGRVKAVISPKGGVTFKGLTDDERDSVTDACIYRRLLVSGSALALAKIAQAEQLAGRTINKAVLAQGHHSHDGGKTWHDGH